MEIDQNLQQLNLLLTSRGWVKHKIEDNLFQKFSNSFLFTKLITIQFPLDKTSYDFPVQLQFSINRLCQIDPEFKKKHIVNLLISQSKNMLQKFSKNKKDWILKEPNSKYLDNEIPDIYIPKK